MQWMRQGKGLGLEERIGFLNLFNHSNKGEGEEIVLLGRCFPAPLTFPQLDGL